jgi:hypothetical protein
LQLTDAKLMLLYLGLIILDLVFHFIDLLRFILEALFELLISSFKIFNLRLFADFMLAWLRFWSFSFALLERLFMEGMNRACCFADLIFGFGFIDRIKIVAVILGVANALFPGTMMLMRKRLHAHLT